MSIDRVATFTPCDHAELRDLARAVKAPEDSVTWPGNSLEWAPAEWYVRAREASGRLISVTGMVLRQGRYDGRLVKIGGIGGVKTHPDARRQGHAARTLTRAVEFFHVHGNVAFGLLVCDADLIAYYTRLGWHTFEGCLLTRNAGLIVEFTLARVMTRDINAAGPRFGTIDICGPPW